MQKTPTLLIVDDDYDLARMLSEYLSGEGFAVRCANSGVLALSILREEPFDLVILDIMMPVLDGLETLRRLRAERDVAVLMLTARGQDEDRILGLELGADDYLSKPFNPRELSARVRAILRRRDRTPTDIRATLNLGPLAIDPASLSVTMNKREIRLTSAEFVVLDVLARSVGNMQTRALLTEKALGRQLEPFDRSIDTHVSTLRRKLGFAANAAIEIRSVRGAGYVLTMRADVP
jgi:DNA-binding response OmpR family regulator